MLLLLLIRGMSASMDCETMMRNGSNAKTPKRHEVLVALEGPVRKPFCHTPNPVRISVKCCNKLIVKTMD